MHKGLGQYIYNVKGYKKIATVGEDYSFGLHAGIRTWTRLLPAGWPDHQAHLGSAWNQGLRLGDIQSSGRRGRHLLGPRGRRRTEFPQSVPASGRQREAVRRLDHGRPDRFVGAGQGQGSLARRGFRGNHQADAWDDPKWQAFVKAYQQAWPPEKRFAGPSLCATNYYDETSAMLRALDEVNGDLSDGQKKFRAALASMTLDAPNGQMKLDENRQAIGTSFVSEVVKDQKGNLVSKVVRVIPNVDQRLGFSKEVFDRIGLPAREVPVCKKNYD